MIKNWNVIQARTLCFPLLNMVVKPFWKLLYIRFHFIFSQPTLKSANFETNQIMKMTFVYDWITLYNITIHFVWINFVWINFVWINFFSITSWLHDNSWTFDAVYSMIRIFNVTNLHIFETTNSQQSSNCIETWERHDAQFE